MSKALHSIGGLFSRAQGPSAPAPLPTDDPYAKDKAQADASRAAVVDRASAGRRGTEFAGREIAFDEQQNFMVKKLKRVGASTDLIG